MIIILMIIEDAMRAPGRGRTLSLPLETGSGKLP
jgi:hypothetical protein